MCFAFETAGSSSLCSYTTSSNRVPFVRKSPALNTVLSCSKARKSSPRYKFLPCLPLPPFFPPVKSETLGENYFTYKDTNSIITFFSISDIFHCVLSGSLLARMQVSLLATWLCLALGKFPPQQQSKTAFISLTCILAECFTRLHKKKNIAK